MNLPITEIQPGAYICANGLTMSFESCGAGIPVILLHGGLETCRMWAPVMPVLAGKYRVITPDSRGHGRTDNPNGEISYRLMAEDIAYLIQELDLDRPFVAGYSDGGQVALCMAMNYPGLARGYMVGAAELHMTDPWSQMMQFGLGFDGPGSVDTERVSRNNPDLVQSLQEKHDIFHQPGYWKTLLDQASRRWLIPAQYTQSDYDRIANPLLAWSGDRDPFCPPEQSLELYRMVKTAELAIIPKADHFSMMQQIDIALEVLMNFMGRVE
jgi:pimeloyl-ACP methyl ester carboxylesterase